MILNQYERLSLIWDPALIHSFRLRMYVLKLKVKRFVGKLIKVIL
jgi:hypothetical protein